MEKSASLLFLTGNNHKFEEAQTILNKFGVNIINKSAKGIEIQSDSLSDVAAFCAEQAYKLERRPLFVEDSGIFIDALNGFPGVYSQAAYDKIGCPGILKLMAGLQNRVARYKCAIAYFDEHGLHKFEGECEGYIAQEMMGEGGFAHDYIFMPIGHGKTFAQAPELKESLSHRAIALKKFGSWYKENRLEK